MPPPPPEGSQWPPPAASSFRQVLAAAVRELSATGFVDSDKLRLWLSAIRTAAERELLTDREIEDHIRRALGGVFDRWVERGKLIERVPEVPAYTLPMVKPRLRAELDRRILAAANYIKIRRQEAIEKTLQRFAGWSTSIPPGGDGTIDKREVRTEIAKSVAREKWERRRVAIDQGAKLIANVSEIVATDAGAIAGIWHDRGEHDQNYDARKEHLRRSGRIFLVRDSWAMQEGLVHKGGHQYVDEIERPSQLPFCSCFYQWLVSPSRLPDTMLTRKGQEWIASRRKTA